MHARVSPSLHHCSVRIIHFRCQKGTHLPQSRTVFPSRCTFPLEVEVEFKDAAARLGLPLVLESKTLAWSTTGAEMLPSGDLLAGSRRSRLSQQAAALRRRMNGCLFISKRLPSWLCGLRPSRRFARTRTNVCLLVFAPLRIRDHQIAIRARDTSQKGLSNLLSGAGVFGVEMFFFSLGEWCVRVNAVYLYYDLCVYTVT